MLRRIRLDGFYAGAVSELFTALVATLSFRRWATDEHAMSFTVPRRNSGYRFRTGSVLRVGHVVEIIRPVAVSLREVLHDEPCRVDLTMRWRIEPLDAGCRVQVVAEYRLNRAASLRIGHWRRRLRRHFDNQFAHLAENLEQIQFAENGVEVREKA